MGFVCCAFVEKRHMGLQLLLSKALSCQVQNFTIGSDIQEFYSTWSSFVSVVNHCLFCTVCGGGVCGYALFRHGGGWIPKSRSLVNLLKQGFTKFFTFTKGFY